MFRKRKFHKLTDEELIELYCQQDNKEAVGVLFERYMHLVYGICQKYLGDEDSKDAVMQIFEQLMQKLKSHTIRNFPAWLHSVSRNHCLMCYRTGKNQAEAKNNYHILMESDVNFHQEDNDSFEEKWELLQQGMNSLSRDQQHCLHLFYLEKKCYKDIAIETGYDIKKIKSHIQNGKRNLKIFLDKNNEGAIEK